MSDVPADPYKTVYSPYELAASTVAAQYFVDTNPGAVDPSLVLDDARMAQATEAITQYGEADDPRLGEGTPAREEIAPAPAEEPAPAEPVPVEPAPAEEPTS